MATIILEPDEMFEHLHRKDSQSTLLSGSATLSVDCNRILMTIGKPVTIKAGHPHTLCNTGQCAAEISCRC